MSRAYRYMYAGHVNLVRIVPGIAYGNGRGNVQGVRNM